MKNQIHILNGDALRQRFPQQIEGVVIVLRECLVDGAVTGDSLEEFYKVRARFISEVYGDYSIGDYYTDSVSEFEKIRNIPDKSEINLWFEDDLFCQVNFWFCINLILNSGQDCEVFLIRPNTHTQYGFGGLNQLELLSAYNQRTQIVELKEIGRLWHSYQQNDTNQLIRTAKALEATFPFIHEAVAAHIDRIPDENHPGRPKQSLIEIMQELETESFRPVFREFSKRESIYGFGDLQVKRLFDEIILSRSK